MRLSGTVYSETLGMDTGISIVTPNNLSERREYKVAYLLHGICGNSKTWLDYSMLPVYAASGNTVYVLPDAARSFYTDMKYGFDYFSYVSKELPGIIRNVFNISAKREDTIVMGGSMGGFGALKCAFTCPEAYGACGAFSSGCLFVRERLDAARAAGGRLLPEFKELFGAQLERDFISILGDSLECGEENDIIALITKAKAKGIMPKLYISCGTNDYFYEDHKRFIKKLSELKVDYRYEEWEASHDFVYFNEALKRAVGEFGL